jgi:hypothetical protein
MSESFDPMTQVPKTDEQVLQCFKCGKKSDIWKTQWGLYQVLRMQGKTLVEAYEDVLVSSLPQSVKDELHIAYRPTPSDSAAELGYAAPAPPGAAGPR